MNTKGTPAEAQTLQTSNLLGQESFNDLKMSSVLPEKTDRELLIWEEDQV